MVILDSPNQTPELKQKDYETRSASIKFIEEQPEWESMDIQLRIDPSGKQDPVITRKEHPVESPPYSHYDPKKDYDDRRGSGRAYDHHSDDDTITRL